MALERRTQLLLAVLGVLLASAIVFRAWPRTAATGSSASNGRGQGRTTTGSESVTAPDVHLGALQADRPKPDGVDRDLFRFQAKPATPADISPPRPPQPMPGRAGPPPPPVVPPIALKFVAVVGQGGQKIASLTDGRGVWLGREGDIILGRYKIWHIGEESVDVSYIDGTGRTTIRLNGQ
jgi:hypothetical protein